MERIKKESLQMNNIKIEVWRAYPEFPFVEVSSMGRVRTLDRVVTRGNVKLFIKGKILKQRRNRDGYLCVSFSVNGKTVNRQVNRLVAQTFIPNPDNLPQVNHKDCDRINNCVDNLEWCDASYNNQYREKYGKACNRPVYAVNLETLEVSCFPSQMEASRALEVVQPSINMVIKGQRNQAGGYWFTSADDNAVEVTNRKLGSVVAYKVKKLMDGEGKVEQQWLHDFINEM